MNVMRLIFCGNFEYNACQSELERLFGRYGKVDRVDMKPGFAFIYMDDEHDAEDAIRALDRTEFGRHGRRLRVEWTTKQEHGDKRSGSSRRSSANSRIRRNFAFIRFESQDDATKALDATNTSKLMDRVISVEYAVRDDDERRNGYRTDMRGRERSPESRSRDRGRSASPYGRGVERASPDYGRGSSPYTKPEQRGSPNYGRADSPAYERHRSHSHSPARRERT